jgi:hypothetical protein
VTALLSTVDSIDAATAAGAADPDAGWRATARAVAAGFDPPGGRPAVLGLHPLAGPVWPLDADPEPGELVGLGTRTDAGLELAWYEQDALALRDTGPAPGLRVWGGTEAVPTQDPVARRSAPADDPRAAGLAGAHALGVAARFRAAFVAKARTTSRGWYALTMIEDPTTLKALLSADSALAAAAALLRARPDDPAAGIFALDAARDAVGALLALTGASSLYDGAPMQGPVLHLGALGQHGLFGRDTRLRVTRAYAAPTEPQEDT